MKKSIFARRSLALMLCALMVLAVMPFTAIAADEYLLNVDSSTAATNTNNAFQTVNASKTYNGIKLIEDYGTEDLTATVVNHDIDKYVIDLNGNTLTLGYLSVNMDLEIRGAGTIVVLDGIMIYSGELYLGDGVEIVTDSEIAIMDHGPSSHVHFCGDVSFEGPDTSIAEIGVQYDYKDNPIIFDVAPNLAGSNVAGAIAGVDYYRVFYNDHAEDGTRPTVSSAQVAQFASAAEATEANDLGVIEIVNELDDGPTASTEDDATVKVSGNRIVIGKSEVILSHATLTLDGSIGINLYFDLSGVEGDVSSLVKLNYSGAGRSGSIAIPAADYEGKYKFTIYVSPTEMTKTMTVWFEGDTSGKTWEYSVIKYAKYILDSEGAVYNTAIKDLMASMLNYGAAMQILNGETTDLASDILKDYPAYATSTDLNAKITAAKASMEAAGYDDSNVWYQLGKEDSPVTFGGASLIVSDTTTIRLYLGDGYSTDAKYSYYISYSYTTESESVYENTVEVEADDILKNGYIQVEGIPSGDFNQEFQIAIKNTSNYETVATCEMTVFTYARLLYENSAEGSQNRALAEAIIWYGMSSVGYFK